MSLEFARVEVRADRDGAVLELAGKPLLTPRRQPLSVPSRALGEAVAAEWRRQGAKVERATMPLTRLVTTVLDLMPEHRSGAVTEATGYAATDLLCYRVTTPADLARRQDATWQPWLDWAARHLDAPLVVTRSIEPLDQPPPALAALEAATAGLDDWRLVGLHGATTLLGSLVLGLALERGALEPAAAFDAAFLDELYEIEQWGEEPIQQQRHARLRHDLEAATIYLRLLGQ